MLTHTGLTSCPYQGIAVTSIHYEQLNQNLITNHDSCITHFDFNPTFDLSLSYFGTFLHLLTGLKREAKGGVGIEPVTTAGGLTSLWRLLDQVSLIRSTLWFPVRSTGVFMLGKVPKR